MFEKQKEALRNKADELKAAEDARHVLADAKKEAANAFAELAKKFETEGLTHEELKAVELHIKPKNFLIHDINEPKNLYILDAALEQGYTIKASYKAPTIGTSGLQEHTYLVLERQKP